MKQTHEIRAGYGIWELATETEGVILQLKKEGFDVDYVVFYLKRVSEKTEDVGPDAQPRRLYQVYWRPAGGSEISSKLNQRLQDLMPSRPAEARSGDPEAEWRGIYQYVIMRISKGVAT